MKRNYLIGEPIALKHNERVHQSAFHEAGHAVAIYIGNRQKQLPPIHFQITFNVPSDEPDHANLHNSALGTSWIANVEGGNLIQSLAISEILNSANDNQKNADYRRAFEADIINLLAGPLAEAKYVSEYDGEYFNSRLIDINALKFYGGTSDMEKVNEYLDAMFEDPIKRKEKLEELFNAAFEFIDLPSNWKIIWDLAKYILSHDKTVITCEEAIEVMDRTHTIIKWNNSIAV